jgi:predicted MFS family arabinose efflux permease
MVVTGMMSAYIALLLAFSLSGVGLGLFHPIAFALIARWSPREKRGRMIGNFTAIGDVGRIGISAGLSFIAVGIGWQKTALIYGAVAIMIAFFYYRSLFAQDDAMAKTTTKGGVQLSLGQILRNKRYILAMFAGGLDSFASASLYVFLPFLLLKRGIDPALLGTFTAAFFVGNFFGKTALGRFVDKFGNAQVFIVAEILMAGFIFFLANSTAAYIIVFCSIALGMFAKGTVPVIQTMVSESVEHHGNFEKAFGMGSFVTSMAVTAAPVVLGFVSDRLGIVSAFNLMASIALMAIIPAVWYRLARPSAQA